MSDKVTVELGGKSKYEIAYNLTREIYFEIEKKAPQSKQEYLRTVYECIKALDGINLGPGSKPKGF